MKAEILRLLEKLSYKEVYEPEKMKCAIAEIPPDILEKISEILSEVITLNYAKGRIEKYRKGDYRLFHGHNELARVIDMSIIWSNDWGGHLLVNDTDGMRIFDDEIVPEYAVKYITHLCPEKKYVLILS